MPQTIAVVGDLHYELHQAEVFAAARRQLLGGPLDAVFQLGDHGGYTHCGSRRSFAEGLDFLNGFDRPFHTLVGNHDLEGGEFATDEQSLAGFCEAFDLARPYYTVDLGAALAICLSSTSFRANPASHHEVHLDRAQVAWLAATLEANRRRPTFVFSHAPILGSGARALQSVHLKCPNAWLNHTDDPGQFARLVAQHPQIKLWFSAHNHLGQQYVDSITRLDNCTCVHTGVIGDVSRDGCRQSRLVEFDARGFTLSTVDHRLGRQIIDLRHEYAADLWQRVSPCQTPDEREHFAPPPMPDDADRLEIGASVFGVHRDMLVEYDRELAAPIGVVHDGLGDAEIRTSGRLVEIITADEDIIYRPGIAGRYGQIFAPNPFREHRRSA